MKCEFIQQKFEENTLINPTNIAINFGEENITYGELRNISNTVASILEMYIELQNNMDENIIVLTDKVPLLIEYIIGILELGGVFVPLDPEFPDYRLQEIFKQVNCKWVLTQVKYLEKLDNIASLAKTYFHVLIQEQDFSDEKSYSNLKIFKLDLTSKSEMKKREKRYNENCYIYYTSGSTGKPKGILGKSRSLKHFIDWEIEQFGIDESFNVSQLTKQTFDPFLRDIFVPLCAGGTICMPEDPEIVLHPDNLIKWIDSKQISLIHIVPTLFQNIVCELKNQKHFEHLQYVMLAGEPLLGEPLKKFYELFHSKIQLVNLYGPTETTLAKTFYKLSEKDCELTLVPVGKTIPDTEIFILDKNMQCCKNEKIGQIFIHTKYRSGGYYNNMQLTDEFFIQNPFSDLPDDVIYKTGDLGMQLCDGNFICLGRIDNQVKIRGMRIDLAEIENCILRSKLVRETVVLVKTNENMDKTICAFMIADEKINYTEIRSHLLKELPVYMVPVYYSQIQEMPLLPSGKIDRRALSEYSVKLDTGSEYVAPVNEIQKELASLWSEVLGVKKIGINDNFFYLGGQSLKAAKLVSMIAQILKINIRVKDIFTHDTIQILAEYLKTCTEVEYDEIKKAEEKDTYEVSPAQNRIYLVSMLEEKSTGYNMTSALQVDGKLDIDHLESCYQKLIARHESLRTSFELRESGVVQIIHNNVDFHIERFKVSEKSEKDQELKNTIDKFIRPFNLSVVPLLRIGVVKVSEEKYIILRDMHHMVGDGISEEIMKREICELYADKQLSEIKLYYKDFSEWQKKYLLTDKVKEQEKYWLNVFSGELSLLDFPTDFARMPSLDFSGDEVKIEMNDELYQKIVYLCMENKYTVYMIMLAALNILLASYTGQEDIVVGTPAAGRNRPEQENMIGVFINTLAMRNYPARGKTFNEFLTEVSNRTLEAFENQDYQFEKLIEKLAIPRDLGRNPLFNVLFNLQNMQFQEDKLVGLKSIPYKLDKTISKFDLSLIALEKNQHISICFEYSIRLFEKDTIRRFAEHYINILNVVTSNPDILIGNINFLSKGETDKLLYGFNATSVQYESTKMIHELFEAQVDKSKDKIALRFHDREFTYQELNERANQVAHLLQRKGIGNGSIVGLMVCRSPEMIIGQMAVLKSGGAYLPIDPTYPQDRVRYMLENSGCRLVLTGSVVEISDFGMETINLFDEDIYSGETRNPHYENDSRNLAYVIYTSGSTGKPKGVMLEHRSVVNFIAGMTKEIDFFDNKSILNLTTISFDIFVLESLLPLVKGLTIVIADENQQLDPDRLSNLIVSENIDILQITPSRMNLLLHCKEGIGCLSHVNEILVGGESFPEKLFDILKNLKNTKLYNVYGPTETTVWSTVKRLYPNSKMNIGKPIANTQVYILGKNHTIQPIGIKGEMFIAGDGLARGYLNNLENTQERFVKNTVTGEGLMYKTGDLARWLPDGDIEFWGRNDFQVKLRGYRIELQEIERCMKSMEEITDCVCMIRKDENGLEYLAAYYLADEEMFVEKIRSFLLKSLPDYMIPQIYIHLEKIPLTPNGKVDRRSLPVPDVHSVTLNKTIRELKSDTEKEIKKIWSNLLMRADIGADENFFNLGGTRYCYLLCIARLMSFIQIES